MPDRAKLIADSVARAFNGSPKAAASDSESPSGNGDADEARDNFHSDLQGTICPDCHAAVKQVMAPATPVPNSNFDSDGNELPLAQQHTIDHP